MHPDSIDRDYDHLIGLVYQGALEQQPWKSALPALREALDAQVASLVLRPPSDDDQGVILNCVRPQPGELDAGEALADPSDWEVAIYREQFFSLDPFINLPRDQVITLDDLLPDAELMASDYYLHYLKPIDLFSILGVDTAESGGMLARLRFSRRHSERRFDKADRELLALITPHLQRAVGIFAGLNRMTSERDIYAGAVNQLSVATIILDEQARVLNSNPVAAAILEDGDGLGLREQRLVIAGREINSKLQAAVSSVIRAQQGGETGLVRALRVPRSRGRSDLGLVVRPVPASEWNKGQSAPSAAVFISDPDVDESASQQILGELFELTPAEAKLAILLSRGYSLAQASERQNISQHTARAQLKSVFSKTGISRQAELVRLILKSVASLG